MPDSTAPHFRALDQPEIEAILARNHIGRLAFTFKDRVDIEPINYAYADGVINCRTSPGAKTEILRRQPAVAFEVDEIEGPYDWRSVVVHGSVYVAKPTGSEHDIKAHADAVRAIRSVTPEALGPDDPAPFRSIIFRLHVHRAEGREARSR